MASTHLDILWVDDLDSDDGPSGKECVIRSHIRDAKFISAAMTAGAGASTGVPRSLSFKLLRESQFLPTLLGSDFVG